MKCAIPIVLALIVCGPLAIQKRRRQCQPVAGPLAWDGQYAGDPFIHGRQLSLVTFRVQCGGQADVESVTIRGWDFGGQTSKKQFTPGVQRFRSIEEMDAAQSAE